MKRLATLSTLGIPMNPLESARKLIEYYNESNHSQSNLFFGEVRSLAARIMECQEDPNKLSDAIANDLKYILGNYFDAVELDVTASENGNGTYDLIVSGSYSYDGVKYTLDEKYSK